MPHPDLEPITPGPDSSSSDSSDTDSSGRHSRHRPGGGLNRPAAAVTVGIAVGSLALAGFAGLRPGGPALEPDAVTTSMSAVGPVVADAVVAEVRDGVARGQADQGSVRMERIQLSHDAMALSATTAQRASSAATQRSQEIAAQRAAAKKAAEAAAARQAAEEAAARESAEEAAAQQAAADRATEEAAAKAREEAAAAQPASREAERPAATAPVSPPDPAPAPAPPVSSGDPRSIARGMLGSYGWGGDQFGCLDSLWTRESGWSVGATNPSSGAYGIPQALPAGKMASAGADWRNNPATQIRWGLGYISGRYGTPCAAWGHSQSHGWY